MGGPSQHQRFILSVRKRRIPPALGETDKKGPPSPRRPLRPVQRRMQKTPRTTGKTGKMAIRAKNGPFLPLRREKQRMPRTLAKINKNGPSCHKRTLLSVTNRKQRSPGLMGEGPVTTPMAQMTVAENDTRETGVGIGKDTRLGESHPQKGGRSTIETFSNGASMRPFHPGSIPTCNRPTSYNSDIEIGSFRPRKYTWAGEQRKGAICHIIDSIDRIGHTRREMGLDCFLAKPAPLPEEINRPIEFIQDVDKSEVAEFWTNQLRKVRDAVMAAEVAQKQWGSRIPTSDRDSPPSLRAVALLHLMQCFGLGGWPADHTIHLRIPDCGGIRTDRGFPRDDAAKPPPGIREIWTDNRKRFATRARASGVLNSNDLWLEAMTQVSKVWLAEPRPLDEGGKVIGDPRDPR